MQDLATKSVCCPLCDRPLPLRASRGGLMVTSEPWRVFWQGEVIGPFSPMQSRFLYLLLSFGRVAHGVLEMHLEPDTRSEATKVHMSTLRSLLRAARIPAKLNAIHGWGYELEIEGT